MVDNTLALGVKPYGGVEQQLNPMNMLLAASQLRGADTQNELRTAQTQQAQQEIETKKRTFIGSLAGEANMAPDDQLIPTYKQKLEEARPVIGDAAYQAARARADTMSIPQLRQMLMSLQVGGLPPEQQIALDQKNKDRQMGRDIIGAIAPAMGSGVAPAAGQPPSSVKPSPFFETLRSQESDNNPSAVSLTSRAGGLYQIQPATWDALAKKYPDAELTPEGRTGSTPSAIEQQAEAARRLTTDNAQVLVKSDIPPTDKNLAMAHFLGATDAVPFMKGLKEKPNTPAFSLVSEAAVKANPSVFFDSAGMPKTVAGVYNAQTAKFSDGSTLGFVLPGNMPTSADPDEARMQKMLPQLRLLRMSPGIPESVAKGIDETIKHYEKATEPTGDMKDYNLIVAQARAKGEDPPKYDDWLDKNNKSKAQQTVVNAFANPLVKGLSDQFVEDRDKARAAANDIRAIHMAREQVDQGIIAGAGADWRLWATKVGSLLGVPSDKITSTEAFSSQIGQRVVNIVKAFGSGSGISNADRDYAAQMAGGNIKLDESSIKRILDIGERANRGMIDRYNKDAEKFGKELPDEAKAYRSLLSVNVPDEYKKPDAPPAPRPSSAAIPPAAIAALQKEPSRAAEFDRYYGAGSAAAALAP